MGTRKDVLKIGHTVVVPPESENRRSHSLQQDYELI